MQRTDDSLATAVCQVVPGTRLGSCEVLLEIARGGMAQVWAARQHGARGFSRLVALKTVLPELAEPEFEAMFLEEARLAAGIHHPSVCEIFELVESGGVLALAMEWIDGETLHALLEASRARIDRRVSAQIVAHVASGLHAAHELRDECGVPLHIVHRDVSPHNVLISRDGHVKVTDFGVAKAIGGTREQTLAGQIKGKPSYMSPEQARCEPLDRRSDIFSLGVLLYVATVGRHPFRKPGQRRRQQMVNLLANDVTPPSAAVSDYPKALEAIVLRAIRDDPKERFSTADDMRRELCQWVMQTGGLVTEADISGALLEHLGASIEKRGRQVANALLSSRERQDVNTSAVLLAADAGTCAPAQVRFAEGLLVAHEARTEELTLAPTSTGAPQQGRRRAPRLSRAAPLLVAASCGALGAAAMYSVTKERVSAFNARSSPAHLASVPRGVELAAVSVGGADATPIHPAVEAHRDDGGLMAAEQPDRMLSASTEPAGLQERRPGVANTSRSPSPPFAVPTKQPASTSCPKFVPGSPRPRCAGEGHVESGPMGHSALGPPSTLGETRRGLRVSPTSLDRARALAPPPAAAPRVLPPVEEIREASSRPSSREPLRFGPRETEL
jgi:hypothetical protein